MFLSDPLGPKRRVPHVLVGRTCYHRWCHLCYRSDQISQRFVATSARDRHLPEERRSSDYEPHVHERIPMFDWQRWAETIPYRSEFRTVGIEFGAMLHSSLYTCVCKKRTETNDEWIRNSVKNSSYPRVGLSNSSSERV